MPKVSPALRPDWIKIPQREYRDNYRKLCSAQDLAHFWSVDPSQLKDYAYHIDKRLIYRTFEIPRRNGEPRLIDAPSRTLEHFQRLLHESLTRVYGPHPGVHGFLAKRSIVTNAKNHLRSRYVLNIDLEDFFPSITRKRIFWRLVSAPYSFQANVANLIAALSTNYYGRLPQGGPSSPVLANIIASSLDDELGKLCRSLGCRYTRYADDITISKRRGELPPAIARYPSARGTGQVIVGDDLAKVISKNRFRINHRKSRLQSYWTRQVCTGLIVNGDRVSPPKRYIRNLRSLIDHWQKKGWQDAAEVLRGEYQRRYFRDREKLLNHVLGRIAYLRMVRGEDDPVAQRLFEAVEAIPKHC